MLKDTTSEEFLKAKVRALTDSDTIEWMQKKAGEYMRLMSYYRFAIMEVETKFHVLNEEFSLEHDRNPINGIKSRLKEPASIRDKLKKRGLPLSVESIEENLNDIAGVRVVCTFLEDVYALARSFLMQDDVTLIKMKDYIASPKKNGYRSLHMVVAIPIFLAHEKRMMKVEIQLRTIAMDSWAALEHQLNYKKADVPSVDMENELLMCAQLSAELDQRMNALRKTVWQNEASEEETTGISDLSLRQSTK